MSNTQSSFDQQSNTYHVTTAVSALEMRHAVVDIVPLVVERNVSKIVASRQADLESFVTEYMLGAANRRAIQDMIEKAIKDTVREVVCEMLGYE